MTNKTNSQEMNRRTAYSGTSEQMKGGNGKMITKLKNFVVKAGLVSALLAGVAGGYRGCSSLLERPTYNSEIDGAKITYSCFNRLNKLAANTISVEKEGLRYEFTDEDVKEDMCTDFRSGNFNRNSNIEVVVLKTPEETRSFRRGADKWEESIFKQADETYNSLREKLHEKLKTEAQEIADNMPK